MAYNPTVNPQSLSQLSSVPLYATLDAARWLREGQQADAQGLADLPQQYAHQQAMRPLQREQARLGNETTLAQLPGVRADSSMRERKNELEAFTFNDTQKAAVAKLANELSGEEIKAIETQAYKLRLSENKEDQKRGMAMMMASKEMMMLKQKQDAAMALEKEQTNRAYGVADRNNASRERTAALSKAIKDAAAQAKTPTQWQALAVQLQTRLMGETDPAAIAELQAQIVNAQTMAERLRPQATPQIDPAITGGALVQGRGAVPTPQAPGQGPKLGTKENPIKLD